MVVVIASFRMYIVDIDSLNSHIINTVLIELCMLLQRLPGNHLCYSICVAVL